MDFFSNNPEVFAVIVNCTYCTCTLISFVISFFYLITFYRNHGIRLGRIFIEMGISLINFSITQNVANFLIYTNCKMSMNWSCKCKIKTKWNIKILSYKLSRRNNENHFSSPFVPWRDFRAHCIWLCCWFLKFTIKFCFIDNKGLLLYSLLSQQCTQYGGILNTFANFDNNRISLRDS